MVTRYIGQRDDVWSGRRRPRVVTCPDLTIRYAPDGMADYVVATPWWRAMSELPVHDLLHLFDKAEVPCLLYEVIHGMQAAGPAVMRHRKKWHPLFIQVAYTDWAVDLCLTEVGVILDETVA